MRDVARLQTANIGSSHVLTIVENTLEQHRNMTWSDRHNTALSVRVANPPSTFAKQPLDERTNTIWKTLIDLFLGRLLACPGDWRRESNNALLILNRRRAAQ